MTKPPPPPPPPPRPRRVFTTTTAAVALTAVALLWPTALPSPWTIRLHAVPLSEEHVARLPKFPPNLAGPYAPNTRLQSAIRLFEGAVDGSESVAIGRSHTPDHLEQLAMLDRSGRLLVVKMSTGGAMRFEELKSRLEPPREIGLVGRPLGFTYDDKGRLLVCDSTAGLVRYDPKNQTTEILSNAVTGGPRLQYINDVDIGPDGAIYFTSCTEGRVGFGHAGFYDTNRAAMLNLFEGRPTGRLLRYQDGRTTVLLDGLFYANGVSVAKDGSYVLVVETFGARVLKYHLTGARAGTSEVFVENLPGFPDGISAAASGGYWVALVARPSPLVLLPFAYAWVRTLIAHIWAAGWLEPAIKPWGMVVRLSESGTPTRTLMDPTGERVRSVSAVHQNGAELYIGNLHGNHVSVLKLAPDEV